MWAFNIKLGPPLVPGSTPTTLGRPGMGSMTSTSRPSPPSQEATKRAIGVSPLPAGLREGLTDSIATSSQMRSSSSANRLDLAIRFTLGEWRGSAVTLAQLQLILVLFLGVRHREPREG